MAKARQARKTTTTATAATQRAARTEMPSSRADFMGFSLRTWISTARIAKGAEARSGSRAFVIAFDSKDAKKTKAALGGYLAKWQMESLLASDHELSFFQGSQGGVAVLRLPPPEREMNDLRDATLSKSPYARARDHAGSIFSHLYSLKADKWILDLAGTSHEQRRGLLIGLELASYSFSENRNNPRKPRKKLPALLFRADDENLSPAEITACSQLAFCTNLTRHLVNVPAGELNPRTYAEAVRGLFEGSKSVEVEVWEGARLENERMNLLRAVGGAAEELPRLVRIRYRPRNPRAGQKPIALVGKGITFDSGGLDIKPSSGMRLMKKDMGGSAACVGVAKWAEVSQLDIPLDIYLSLAENAISGPAFRPGDIITSRNGLTIEIHNTDAEGRLVLADALDVAVNQRAEDQPAAVIDLATLTGAIKVGLGSDIAGLFSNNDVLADALLDAGTYRGDLAWRMPLYAPYKTMLRSSVADYANASDGFAGAITAALFLEFFVGKVPWAHLDIYSWKDSGTGAYTEAGGNGQPVQMLAEFFTRISEGADGLKL